MTLDNKLASTECCMDPTVTRQIQFYLKMRINVKQKVKCERSTKHKSNEATNPRIIMEFGNSVGGF